MKLDSIFKVVIFFQTGFKKGGSEMKKNLLPKIILATFMMMSLFITVFKTSFALIDSKQILFLQFSTFVVPFVE